MSATTEGVITFVVLLVVLLGMVVLIAYSDRKEDDPEPPPPEPIINGNEIIIDGRVVRLDFVSKIGRITRSGYSGIFVAHENFGFNVYTVQGGKIGFWFSGDYVEDRDKSKIRSWHKSLTETLDSFRRKRVNMGHTLNAN